MIQTKKIIALLLLTSLSIFGQEVNNNNLSQPTLNNVNQDSVYKKPIKISFLDSIKSTFINDEMASCIDNRWTQELAALDVYNDLLLDIKTIDPDVKVDYELPTELLKERLKLLDEKSPFNIEYNIGLENVIKSFLKNRKKGFERLMGISQFYFPIFEEELAKNNIPLEIKYLAVVESALNPLAVSRVGATGLWQFMYQTGKQYGLNITSYEDERSDPLKASQAASQYMLNMYKIFGDWDLVLASYNSGPGNVAKAIRRSGGQQNYWNIRKNLPKETQGYLPAFLATMYIFEYHKEHGIVPNKAIANHFATDTIMVKKHMTFKQISDLLDISTDELKFYNPSYKRGEVPFVTGDQNFLRLPKDKIAVFTSNEDKVYAYVAYEESKREKPNQNPIVQKIAPGEVKFHKVQKGDNIADIAAKYEVSEDDIKKWNGLKSSYLKYGKNLKIKISESSFATKDTLSKPAVASNEVVAEAVATVKIKPQYVLEKVTVLKDVTKTHKVKSGDNLGEIAQKYDVSVADIKKWNKIKGSTINPGDKIKIIKNEKVTTTIKKEVKTPAIASPKQIEAVATKTSTPSTQPQQTVAAAVAKKPKVEVKKSVDTVIEPTGIKLHTVVKKDALYSIAKAYNVQPDDIRKWNKLADDNLKVGTQLIVSSSASEPIAEVKNIEHVVAKGEFLGAIARKYKISIDDLRALNHIEGNAVQAGTTLIVGKTSSTDVVASEKENTTIATNAKKVKEKIYQVKQGDSLYKIAKKFPGVSVSDLKKWNGIKEDELKPGMKLKING
jgi:membrane-bound lytic murein transglycosylase D